MVHADGSGTSCWRAPPRWRNMCFRLGVWTMSTPPKFSSALSAPPAALHRAQETTASATLASNQPSTPMTGKSTLASGRGAWQPSGGEQSTARCVPAGVSGSSFLRPKGKFQPTSLYRHDVKAIRCRMSGLCESGNGGWRRWRSTALRDAIIWGRCARGGRRKTRRARALHGMDSWLRIFYTITK